ncbi:leucine--tRNA ligase [Candidatus Saccharibacteria bacterium]|nr:leucine--tRNA ligase [Candidatus Saccharibacteria bacterium]
MNRYNPLEIEQKWQARWEAEHTFAADDNSTKPKMYLAEMFPYPSGAGLHVGHVRNFTIVDVLTRFYAQQELNVLRPFGYDTFGLPAENYAIKTGISPQEATATNIANFRKQAKKLGYAIDWSREINTSDPEYYRWTQWCFLKLFEKGLAYQKESYQWWCPVDQTVLANEQVENGCCWRCGHEVEKKKMKQWFFKITAYADELLADIDSLDWPEKIKTAQRNWIGRSEGAEVDFKTTASTTITVFTTRPDTLFGATFLVLAPEHPLVKDLITKDTKSAVEAYIKSALKKSEIERQENKEKTGVFTGSYAINPVNGEQIPIWVADYVLSGYGTGAIMAVPAHDERDFEFAEKFSLPVIAVVEPPKDLATERCYHGEGTLVNSGEFTGLASAEARESIVAWLESRGIGHKKVTYKMRDWLISRQRYWGCPIPIAYDKSGHPHPIPEDQLPVIHPEVKNYVPDSSGRSALAKAKDWLKVEINGEEMTRETDTLDGYACSSWYLWRYVSAHDKDHAWDPELIKYWAPTDIYVGGDHAVAHLLYVRFWCKFFADLGLLPFREPIKKLLYNGYINAPDGKKMSKSKGNVIDPLDVIDSGYGADTLRTYEMFIGPYNEDAAWSTKGVAGVYRFLNRCWTLCFAKPEGSSEAAKENPRIFRDGHEGEQNVAGATRTALRAARLDVEKNQTGFSLAKKNPSGLATKQIRHKTIKKVTEDLHRASFNTAVAALMEYVNELYKIGASSEDLITLAKLLKPFAPHLASEMLESLGADDVWPTWDEAQLIADTVEIVVQVNGKLRARLSVPAAEVENEEKIVKLALSDANVQKFTASGVKKHIYIQRAKLLNLVV